MMFEMKANTKPFLKAMRRAYRAHRRLLAQQAHGTRKGGKGYSRRRDKNPWGDE